MGKWVAVGITDGGLIGFSAVIATLVVGFLTVFMQNRHQKQSLDSTAGNLGQPNGGGSIAADVHALSDKVSDLTGAVREHNRATDRRLDRIERKLDEG